MHEVGAAKKYGEKTQKKAQRLSEPPPFQARAEANASRLRDVGCHVERRGGKAST